jgi:uncharacterized protein YxjI
MRYLMRHRSAWQGGSFSIEDADGRCSYRVSGEDASPGGAVVLEDSQGVPLSSMRFTRADHAHTCEIRHDQHQVQVVRSEVSARRIRFRITLQDEVLVAQGNIGQDEYVVRHGLRRLAAVSKKGVRDTGAFGVEIAPGTDDVLLLSIVLAISILTDSLTPPPAPPAPGAAEYRSAGGAAPERT